MKPPWWAEQLLACLAALAVGLVIAHTMLHYLFGNWWPW